jgi:hypothetical protein
MKRIALMGAVIFAACLPAEAQQGSRDEQAACRSDTRRFCRAIDPDSGTFGILNCLKENRPRLSRACRALLESHGQ